jgi:hypothetical protein
VGAAWKPGGDPGWSGPPVRILVAVASTQGRYSLRTDAGNGSAPTGIGRGLVGPKAQANAVQPSRRPRQQWRGGVGPKGKRVKIPAPSQSWLLATATKIMGKPLHRGGVPGGEFSSLYNGHPTPEWHWSEKGWGSADCHSSFGVSGISPTRLETRGAPPPLSGGPYK